MELDALRGIAAFSVMLFHYSVVYPRLFPAAGAVNMPFEVGSAGVFLFFSISGFVISLTLKGTPTVLDFAVKRFARLFPVYWAAIALTTCVVRLSGTDILQVPWPTVLINLTMVQGFLFVQNVDGVYWTLSVELAFYACAMAIWFGFGFRRLEPVLLGWLLISLWARSTDILPFRIQMLLITQHCGFFVLGMLAYRVHNGERTWLQQLPYSLAAIGVLFCEGGWEQAIDAIVIQFILWATLAGWLRILRHGFLRYLGVISYAFYLIHHHIGFVMLLWLGKAGVSPWLAVGLTSGAMILVASLLHYTIEKPAEWRIRRWWKGYSAAAARPASSAQ